MGRERRGGEGALLPREQRGFKGLTLCVTAPGCVNGGSGAARSGRGEGEGQGDGARQSPGALRPSRRVTELGGEPRLLTAPKHAACPAEQPQRHRLNLEIRLELQPLHLPQLFSSSVGFLLHCVEILTLQISLVDIKSLLCLSRRASPALLSLHPLHQDRFRPHTSPGSV